MDESQDFVLCVDERGERQREIDYYERIDGFLRKIPKIDHSRERIEWVYGDDRPHIFRSREG